MQDDFVQLLKVLQKTRRIEVKYGMVWSKDRDPIGKQVKQNPSLGGNMLFFSIRVKY